MEVKSYATDSVGGAGPQPVPASESAEQPPVRKKTRPSVFSKLKERQASGPSVASGREEEVISYENTGDSAGMVTLIYITTRSDLPIRTGKLQSRTRKCIIDCLPTNRPSRPSSRTENGVIIKLLA